MKREAGLQRGIRTRSAVALVVANMIGAGIFTTTGFQAEALGHPAAIYTLWVVGGLLALCGALAYSELGAAMPRAGGEYVYLREAYGGAFGFMSALVSLTAGFSAPIASALKALVRYASHFFPVLADEPALWGGVSLNDAIAIVGVWVLVAIHTRGLRSGMRFNDWITLFKVAGIVGILIATAAVGKGSAANLVAVSPTFEAMGRDQILAGFGTSLIFVMFCYSGWNAAAYMAGEMREPRRGLPRALLVGTGLVTVLYLALNLAYLYGADVDDLAGKVEVGLVASRGLFGEAGVSVVVVVLCISLLASASAMTIAGPRVYFAAGRDSGMLRFLSRTHPATGVPVTALVAQGVVTSGLILAGRVDQIQQYAGFTLSLFASLAVSCVIVLRIRRPEMPRPFRTWGYPVTPLLFVGVSVWMMYWAFQGRPVESSLALLTVAIGGVVYGLSRTART
jgi:APA family basic amino acid/polyamine antiporter